MRITTNSIITSYSANLKQIEERQQRENTRLTTGKSMIDLSDDTRAVMNLQYFNESIAKNSNYIDNAQQALDEPGQERPRTSVPHQP